MGNYDYYERGDWNAACDQCGQKRKASMLKLQWDGLRCCEKCWEPRQPQDYVRGVPDPTGVPWSRFKGMAFANMAERPNGEIAPITPIPEDE